MCVLTMVPRTWTHALWHARLDTAKPQGQRRQRTLACHLAVLQMPPTRVVPSHAKPTSAPVIMERVLPQRPAQQTTLRSVRPATKVIRKLRPTFARRSSARAQTGKVRKGQLAQGTINPNVFSAMMAGRWWNLRVFATRTYASATMGRVRPAPSA